MAWWTRRRALVVGAFAVVVVGGVTWAALASQPGPTPLARSATPSASASGPVCDAQFSVTKQWEGGYQGEVTVTAWAPLADWRVALNLEGATVSGSWDSTLAVGATGLATGGSLAYAYSRRQTQAVERFAAAAMETLLNAIEANDEDTGMHVRRVAACAR